MIHQYAQVDGLQAIVAVHVERIFPREAIRIPVEDMMSHVGEYGNVSVDGKPCEVHFVEWADGSKSFAQWLNRRNDLWILRSCSDNFLIGFSRN